MNKWSLDSLRWGKRGTGLHPFSLGILAGSFALLTVSVCNVAGRAAEGHQEQAGRAAQPEDRPAIALPGAGPLPLELTKYLWEAYQAKGPGYEPRTEHLRADGSPVYVNRLILEDSPYLIQHAHNPIDWYPWGPEAFEKARRENKPIFLSIGYSTCHWCHVMEKECFDVEEVARLMNESVVSIKVDREQRPDVDEVYMTAVQLLTGRGGWPMSSLLTPDGKPFFGGTYIPRDNFMNLLRQADQAWRTQQPQIVAKAKRIADQVRQITAATGEAVEVGEKAIAAAVSQSVDRHDSRLGGFSGAPKFPHEPELLFLLEQTLRSGDRAALAAVETSLDHMARGGIYDQVGGGFHRYSTDARWMVPHFEKMLYNQAHLARAYLEASRLTGNLLYERVSRQTLDYVLRDMTSRDGGFYSATDADSEGREGVFFLWTPERIRSALPSEDVELALDVFAVTASGNFEGENILHLPKPLPEVAAQRNMPLQDLLASVDRIRERLYEVREERIHPLRDEKIVTAWNGMMITSLARAGEALGEERYLDSAKRAAHFIWEHNRRDSGGLWRAHLDGSSSVEANLDDYAYLCEALCALYDATGRREWLERAGSVADAMIARFWDEKDGGFFMSENDHGGRLPARPKSPTDGAIPSGNSVAIRVLAMLANRTGQATYRQRAEAALAAFSGQIARRPTAFAYMLLGAAELLHGSAGPLEYGSGGVVSAKSELDPESGPGRFIVHLNLADGWHVNSHQPLQDELIPTRLGLTEGSHGFELGAVRYPDAETITLGFQEEPLAVYQGSVLIRGTIVTAGVGRPSIARLSLTIQACDDEKCLKPEDLTIELPVPGVAPSQAAEGWGRPFGWLPGWRVPIVATTGVGATVAAWWFRRRRPVQDGPQGA